MTFISHNGRIIADNDAVISVFDRLYLYGDGIIEVVAGCNGQALRVDAHVERLYRSAELIRLILPWPPQKIVAELNELASFIPNGRSYLRLSVSAGKGTGLARTKTEPQRTIICQAIPRQLLTTVSLVTRMRSESFLVAAKTNNYLATIVSQQQAQEQGYDDLLWVNNQGQVTEASTANIFFVSKNRKTIQCHTPAPGCGLLTGITASWVKEILNKNTISVQEQIILADQCRDFCGAFLTSTIKGVQQVSAIDNLSYRPQEIAGILKLISP